MELEVSWSIRVGRSEVVVHAGLTRGDSRQFVTYRPPVTLVGATLDLPTWYQVWRSIGEAIGLLLQRDFWYDFRGDA